MMLTLPYPPSTNTYWRSVKGRVLISKGGRMYRHLVGKSVQWQHTGHKILTGRLSVTVDVYPPDRRRRDLDNVLKALLDSMEHAGVYENDSQIDRLEVIRRDKIQDGQVIVRVVSG